MGIDPLNNQDMLDRLSVLSFIIGAKNYQENLTQNDKADIMNSLDAQTKTILSEIEKELERQNEMLAKIMKKLEI